MKNNMKVILLVIFSFILGVMLSGINWSKDSTPFIRGKESLLINNSYIYLFVNENRVDYYQIPKDEVVNCEYISADKVSLFCGWYFKEGYDPLWGWISSKDVIFNYKN